jgi:hypothetical protein
LWSLARMSEPAKFLIFGIIIMLLAVLALWFPSPSDPRDIDHRK